MKVLILGLNYAPEKVGIAVYTTGMAEALVRQGHTVQVVAGRPYYPAWRITEGHNAWTFGRAQENGVVITRVPHYIPGKPSGFKRVLHHTSFALTSLFPTLARAISFRPDVVLTVAPSSIAAPVARFAAAISGARSWLHVQDFEVEAAFATGLLGKEGRAARTALAFERWVLTGFDRVTSISPQMCMRLVAKGVDCAKVGEFRNWADIGAIRPIAPGTSTYRAEWGITTPHVALYSGNIANKQGIEIVLEAARELKDRNDLTFVVCGEGPNRANLIEQAQGLDNIQFHDLQPKERLADLLGLASVHLLPQLAGAADLVLPSKMTNMLASGRPIVATALPGSGIAMEVDQSGLVIQPDDVEAFSQAIVTIIDNPERAASMCKSARQRAESHWAGDVILGHLNTELQSLVSSAGEHVAQR